MLAFLARVRISKTRQHRQVSITHLHLLLNSTPHLLKSLLKSRRTLLEQCERSRSVFERRALMSSACVQVKESLRPRARSASFREACSQAVRLQLRPLMSLMLKAREEYCFVVETSAAEGVEPQSLAEARRLPEWSEWRRR